MMANFSTKYFLVLVLNALRLISWRLQGVSAIDDFTCVTKPRIHITPNTEDTYIAGYFVARDVSLSFDRTIDTYTGGSSLPPQSSLETPETTGDETIAILQMSAADQMRNIGAFTCTATKAGGDVSMITTVIMSKSADFLPTHVSRTVNRGDAVNLTVTATNQARKETRWRKDASEPFTDRSGLLYFVISNSASADSAIYEAHFAGERTQGDQALMRLIVRGCEETKWDAPSCDSDCPVCFNGGVCEDGDGVCICPPGFSGDFCEILLGPDRFGQDGSLRCDSDELLGSTCGGKLFCLPDPYGCTCATGYQGIDCETECSDGSFGANCAQTCHCLDDVACNKTTGRCPGDCASGFKGINCQDSCSASMGGLAGDCSTPCTVAAAVNLLRDVTPTDAAASEIHVSWKFVSNRCAVDHYQVQYQLTNKEQCLPVTSGRVDGAPDNYYADSLIISTNLLSYSTYTVYIRAWNEIGEGPETEISIRTGGSAPKVAPVFSNSSQVSSESIAFSWHTIPCGSRGGLITGYTYEVRDPTGSVIETSLITSETVAVSGLTPCTIYTFRVQAHTSVGPGPWMDSVTAETSAAAPGMVTMLTATSTSVSTQILVTWQKTNNNNCAVEYTVEYALVNRDLCDAISPVKQPWLAGTQSPVTITGLYPHSSYRVYVTAANSAGPGMEQSAEAITQGTAPTGPPSNITIGNVTTETLSFSWDKPQCGNRNGIITKYNCSLTNDVTSVQTKAATIAGTSVDFTGLDLFIVYTLTVSAGNSFGNGPVISITGRTGIPSKPEFLVVSLITQTSILLEWSPPLYPNGNIVKYVINHRVIARPYDSSFSFETNSEFESQEILDMSARSGTVYMLEPSTKYEFQVYIVNGDNIESETATLQQFTALATDLPPPERPILGIKEQSTSTSITIRLISTSSSKYITSYQVGVKKTNVAMVTNEISRRSAPQFGRYSENPSSYVTAELPRIIPEEFVIGDNKTYGGFFNPSLQKGAAYEIYIGAVSRINDMEASVVWNEDPLTVEVDGDSSPQENISAGSIIGITLASLAAVAAILGAAVSWKRRQQLSKKENGQLATKSSVHFNMAAVEEEQHVGPSSSVRTSPSRPQTKPKRRLSAKVEKPIFSLEDAVPLSSLADYIKSKKSTKNGYQTDYESLPVEQLYPWTVAKKEENSKKNRYTNIVAYDHSRVVLECLDDDPHSDYINASYIHGYEQDAKYIACQGPNKASVVDIWRMVWQERAGIIIMLTNLVENGKLKCEKYWPDDVKMYADFSVNNVMEKSYTNYIVRTFHIVKSSEPEGEYRVVTQYHYTTWPDMKSPESSSLLQFVRAVQASESLQPGPMIVHCSAGVGRTGTFISLDAMLAQGQAEGQVIIYKFVRAMREQRVRMVQTLDQYKFIFDALLESCLTENTAIPAARLQQDYAKLKKRDRKTGTTGIEDQYNMLETFTATFNQDKCRGGRESVNLDKNRFQASIPADKSRPYLMTSGQDGSTNYINATFLDGYKEKSTYLATQAPLPNTVGDIWRMVFDYKSTCIVMLNSTDNNPNVPQYWPDDGNMSFGPLIITFRGIDYHNEAVIVRHFSIYNTDRMNDGEQTICHIQFLQWPSGKQVPNSSSSLLKVLEAVRMWSHDHPDGPITVHCIDGLGRSGTLCALMTILDNVRQEQALDVFQAVKKLRATRTGMVQTLAQYQLCYEVTQNYLDSNSIYENLR